MDRSKLKISLIFPLVISSLLLLLLLLSIQLWNLLPETIDILIFAVLLPIVGFYIGNQKAQFAEVFGMLVILIAVALIFNIVITINMWVIISILLIIYLLYIGRKKIRKYFWE